MKSVYKDVEEKQKTSNKKIRIFYEFSDKVYLQNLLDYQLKIKNNISVSRIGVRSMSNNCSIKMK